MADINHGDKAKFTIRLMMWYFHKKYDSNKNKNISFDIENCGNPVIRLLRKKIRNTTKHIQTEYHNTVSNDMVDLMLWILYKDTAYRQPFFYALKDILDSKDELMPMLEKYIVEPDDWYMNRWKKAKELTYEQRKDKKIPSLGMSVEEKFFVPDLQHENYDRLFASRKKELDAEFELQKKRKNMFE